MERQKNGDTVRINENSRQILSNINKMTNIPKVTILFDSLKLLEKKLKQDNYNYSKIIKENPERK